MSLSPVPTTGGTPAYVRVRTIDTAIAMRWWCRRQPPTAQFLWQALGTAAIHMPSGAIAGGATRNANSRCGRPAGRPMLQGPGTGSPRKGAPGLAAGLQQNGRGLGRRGRWRRAGTWSRSRGSAGSGRSACGGRRGSAVRRAPRRAPSKRGSPRRRMSPGVTACLTASPSPLRVLR